MSGAERTKGAAAAVGRRGAGALALRLALALVLACSLIGFARPAAALPSFAQQTGEPCSRCHVGAYGPQLKQYGRDFKLFGYWAADGQNSLPTVALLAAASYTQTRADRTPIAGHSANGNFAYQNAFIAYAGRLAGGVGALTEVFYDAIHHQYSVSRMDFRRAFTSTLAGHDVVWGLDLSNRPGLGDLWNSTPAFEFNTLTSPFAASPSVSTLMDGKLSSRVAGLGGFAMWDDTLYTEYAVYTPLTRDLLNHEGLATAVTADRYHGSIPYARVAVQHAFGDTQYLEAGAFALQAHRLPGAVATAGEDKLTDVGLDATYQYAGADTRNYLAAHAIWIHEDASLDASRQLLATRPSDHLDTVRADAIYSFKDTWTPAVELFRTTGSTDPRFYKTAGGSPNSEGYVVELGYAPFGKKDSPASRWANVKLNARFVGYTRFNGRAQGASANDTFYVGANVAVAPFGALVKR